MNAFFTTVGYTFVIKYTTAIQTVYYDVKFTPTKRSWLYDVHIYISGAFMGGFYEQHSFRNPDESWAQYLLNEHLKNQENERKNN